jgi:radical SAM family uncharacterized protein/radical SAM-linked protein
MSTINLDQILSVDIQRPARYLGKELGAAHRTWDSAEVRWVLSYPEFYEVGASNLGHIILYNILNARLDQLCDRVYLPGPDLAARLRQQHLPLFAVESRRPLQDFDIIGFSLAYELGGTNVLEMLDLAGLPLTWEERNPLSIVDCPLIFAGGPTATSNPEPFAAFFDFFVLGDGEEVLPEIGDVLLHHRHRPRQEVLMQLAQVPGVYVPQFYEGRSPQPRISGVPQRIQRRVATPMPEYSVGLIPFVQTVHDRLTMEVRRGCTRGCRFCQPGMLTRAARDVEPERLVTAVGQGLRQTGYDEFSLSSLSCSDYLSLPAVGSELQQRLGQVNIGLSLPSQRVDRFDESIAQIMGGHGTRRSTLTFAPEAGTQRLRDVINKGLTDADLVRGITTAARQGWKKIKLYFMIGLPGETDADVIGIAHTLQMLKRECAAVGQPHMSFTLTLSNFTPKPHTPFQWFRVDYADIQRKQTLLKQELRRVRDTKANFTDIRFSILEDLIGKGDRSLSPMIELAWRAGAGMDSWFENIEVAYNAWVKAYQGLTDQSMDSSTHLPVLTFGLEDPLPWDHIDTGIDKRWLQRDYERALQAATVPDCSFDSCSACGVCGTDFGHNVVIPAPPQFSSPSSGAKTQRPPEPIPSAQRFRLTYSKQGDMRWLGHLDLMKLWERACRRAGLPLAFTGGYHPTPRIASACALPLGYTSRGEILDLELLPLHLWGDQIRLTPEELQRQLSAQLPSEIILGAVTEIPLKAPAATQSLTAADYLLTLDWIGSQPACDEPHWQDWIQAILASPSLWLEKQTKSGKVYPFDARPLLYDLSWQPTASDSPQGVIYYRGSFSPDSPFLQPHHILTLLQQRATPEGIELQIRHGERLSLSLKPLLQGPPITPDPACAE